MSISAARRLIVVCQEVPYPARHGGQTETWTRLAAWRALGISIHVVFWSTRVQDAQRAVEALHDLGCGVTALPRRRTVASLFQTAVPPLAYSMRPAPVWYGSLVAELRKFGADGIVLENWPGVLTAFALARELRLPVLYRSQNLETEYWREVFGAARGVGRLRLGFTAARIERLERALRAAASLVLDISTDDARGAEAAGMRGPSMVLPPVWRSDTRGQEALHALPEVDVVFGGSLWPPHHVEGVRWLLTAVLPLLRQMHPPGVAVRIVGARPSAELRSLAVNCGAELLADVADFRREILKGRVLVNPVQRSSGINMKMLDLVTSGRPVVSTPAGVRGLSSRVRDLVVTADEPASFAKAIAAALRLDGSGGRPSPVEVVAAEYGVEAQRRALEEVFAAPLREVGQLNL